MVRKFKNHRNNTPPDPKQRNLEDFAGSGGVHEEDLTLPTEEYGNRPSIKEVLYGQ